MTARAALAALVLVGFTSLGDSCNPATLSEEVVHVPGFAEPHTPGAPGVTASGPVRQILGDDPDLNTVTTLRTSIEKADGAPPRIVFILIPGFLGGAGTLSPLARDLVREFNGNAQVWAVERRPNLLEDRRGGQHAAAGTPEAIAEGARFYFAEQDVNPTGNFPGPEDSDIDDDGVLDPLFELPDAFGNPSPFVALAQDDVRFMAHWGVDTFVRDWERLVQEARDLVGDEGLVVLGGHSQGTTWTGLFAAYDFDPGPGVDPGYEKVDGLLLLEGGGPGAGSANKPDRDAYLDRVAELATPGGPNVFLESIFGLFPLLPLGTGAEITGVAGVFQPTAPSIIQRTTFGQSLSLFIQAPVTNRSVVAFFLDDDFSAIGIFRASMGFSDDGTNLPLQGGPGDIVYVAQDEGFPRTWKGIDEPQPTCPPLDPLAGPGCAIMDNGPGPAGDDVLWGVEAEVTDIEDVLDLNFGNSNFAEWYFVEGRLNLDFQYGRDSAVLGDESLLAVTQNASVDKPVLALGGSNGVTPAPESFASYLGSIATPDADKTVVILEGYAHLDATMARENAGTPVIRDWANELLQRKLLEHFEE